MSERKKEVVIHVALLSHDALSTLKASGTWREGRHAVFFVSITVSKSSGCCCCWCCCCCFVTLAPHSKTSVGARGHSTRRTHRRKEIAQKIYINRIVVRTQPAILSFTKTLPGITFGGDDASRRC